MDVQCRRLIEHLAQPRISNDQLFSTLVTIRKKIIVTKHGLETFVRCDGLLQLTALLKRPLGSEVLSVVLSILGNCTSQSCGRRHFSKHGGLHAVINVVDLVVDADVGNRGFRTLANLSKSPDLCQRLHQEDTMQLALDTMRPPSLDDEDDAEPSGPPTSDEMRTTIVRLWRNMGQTRDQQRRMLRTECLALVSECLRSNNAPLLNETLRTLTHFAKAFTKQTGAQIQQCKEALPRLAEMCGVIQPDTLPSGDLDTSPSQCCHELPVSASTVERHTASVSTAERPTTSASIGERPTTSASIGERPTASASTAERPTASASTAERPTTSALTEERPTTSASVGERGSLPFLSLALALVLTLARESSLRPPLGQLGFIQLLFEAAGLQETDGTADVDADQAVGESTSHVPGHTRPSMHPRIYQLTADLNNIDGASLVSALCLFAWESVNRARIRALGYLPRLVALLHADAVQSDSLRRRVLHALFQFVYDDTGFAQMRRAGLLPVLVQRLGSYVQSHGGGVKRHHSSSEESDLAAGVHDAVETFRADSPTYRQVEREMSAYLCEVRHAADVRPPSLYASLSPSASLVSSPRRSPDNSPPLSVASSPESRFSPVRRNNSGSPSAGPGTVLSPGRSSWSPDCSPDRRRADWSPQVSPAAWSADCSSHLTPTVQSPHSRFSPSVSEGDASSQRLPPAPSDLSPGASTTAAASTHGRRRAAASDEEEWLLLLLSRESQREQPDAYMCSRQCSGALIDYLQHAPAASQRAARILARLARNAFCFGGLMRQRLASRFYELPGSVCDQLQEALGSVAQTGYGQGVLESALKATAEEATAAALTAAHVVRLNSSLRRLLLRCDGLSVLLAGLIVDGTRQCSADACMSVVRHATAARVEHAPVARPAVDGCRYAAAVEPHDVSLQQWDGAVPAARVRLAAGSAVLSALLTGGFRESGAASVRLDGLSSAVVEALVHCVYGCRHLDCPELYQLSPPLWLELLTACDRYMLTDAADRLSSRVLTTSCPRQLRQLYSRARQLPLQLEDTGRLHLYLLRQLLATSPRSAARQQFIQLLDDQTHAVSDDVRAVITQLLQLQLC